MIGCAAALLLFVNGRIMGASGILGGLIDGSGEARGDRLAFLGGLVGAPLLIVALTGAPETNVDANWPVLIFAGLLVGIGTRLGAGCTSGHGVCGLSRLSPRSMAAVATFIAAGILTVRAFG
ncbi:YeeE/YedE family protein [Jannaschia sp.]|nr:YeeE/YedE family protein [Jannaschia sp.]